MDVLHFIQWFFRMSWRFFSIKVPGFGFSFGALFVGLFLANLGLRFLFMMLGIGASSHDVQTVADKFNEKPKRRIGF